MRPITGPSRPIAIAPGSTTRPDSVADSPSVPCRYSGSAVMVPKNASDITAKCATDSEKLRERKIRRSSSASSTRCSAIWRHTNSASETTPIASETTSVAVAIPAAADESPP